MAVSLNVGDLLAMEQKIGGCYRTGRAPESLVAVLIVLGISTAGAARHLYGT